LTTYELLVIHSPLLSEQQHQEKLEQLKAVVEKNGGSVVKQDVWGKRRLAFPIKKQREGLYTVVHFDAESQGICLAEVDRICKIDEAVIRHLITRAVIGKSKGRPPEPRGEGRGAAAPAAPAAEAQEETPAAEPETPRDETRD